MIQTDRTFWMYQLLMEYGSLSIPSLGTFTLVQHGSARNGSATHIKPPYTEVAFQSQVDDRYSLSLLLTEYGVMNLPEARKEEMQLVDAYLEHKANGIPFKIEGFGEMNGDTFIPLNKEWFNRYTGLKNVTLPSVVKPVLASENPDIPNFEKQTQPSTLINTFWYWIFAAIILVFTVLVFIQNTRILHDHTKLEQLERQRALRAQERDSLKKLRMDSIRGGIRNRIGLIDAPKRVDIPQLAGQALEKQATGAITECVIIVGTFKNDRNVSEMKDRIQAMGYKAFISEIQELTRVGVAFDCGTVSPDTFLQQIRNKIQPNAWLLKQ